MPIPAGLSLRGGFAARLVIATLALALVACSTAPTASLQPDSSPDPAATAQAVNPEQTPHATPAGPPLAGPIEVTPSGVLLTTRGQTAHLVATATGLDGATLPITWSSSNPDQVAVDGEGNVTAVADLGGALIYADAGDRTTPVAVLIVQPAPGAVLVSDAQIVGEPQPLGDPTALPATGDRYRVRLTGIEAPPPGSPLIATEGARLGGRVVASQATDGAIDVDYELVPMPTLLARYSFAIDIPLDPRESGAAAVERSTELASVGQSPAGGGYALNVEKKVEKEVEFKSGPLKCKASASAKFKSTAFNIKATTNLSVQVEGRKEEANTTAAERTKIVLAGPIALDITGGLKAEAGFEGSASCTLAKYIPVPIGGFIAVFLGLTIPIGLEATMEGKVKAVDIDLGPQGHLGTKVELGFQCVNSACSTVTESTADASNGLLWNTKVTALHDMRVDASVGLNFVTGLAAHAVDENFSLIEAKIGPVQAMSLAFDDAQIRDTGYASNYDLKVAGSVAPSSDLKKIIEKLVGDNFTIDLALKYESDPLSSSPKGTLSTEKPRVQVGKQVTLSIDLDPKSIDYFLIGPNVDGLIISRWKDDALEQIATIAVAASGQTHFEYKWTPRREHLGMNDLVAFVESTGLPAVPLEIAPDSTTKVEVVDACVANPTPAAGVVGGAAGGAVLAGPVALQTAPPPDPCGRGTVTIRQEKHVSYTSPRDNPVQHDLVDTATISFELVQDESDPTRLVSSSVSIDWSYSLTSVESGECQTVEKYSGSGSWDGGPGEGPVVLLGWSGTTLFNMTPDPTKYMLQAFPPINPFDEGDPRGWTSGSSDVCGIFEFKSGAPYTTIAFVDGLLPPGGIGTFAGSRTREVQAIDATNQPTTETVTWSFTVNPPE
jgi:hypothetical protein